MVGDLLVVLFFMVLIIAPILVGCISLQDIVKDGDDDV